MGGRTGGPCPGSDKRYASSDRAPLTLPLTVLSLGIFALIVNGAMLALLARWVTGLHLADFGGAVLRSTAISLAGGLLGWGPLPRA